MAYQSIWYFTNLPEDVVEILDKDLYTNFDHQMRDSKLYGDALHKEKRNSKNTWISTRSLDKLDSCGIMFKKQTERIFCMI